MWAVFATPSGGLVGAGQVEGLDWPKPLAERVRVVETALHAAAIRVSPGDLSKQFARAKPAGVAEILKTLETLGRAHCRNGKFSR